MHVLIVAPPNSSQKIRVYLSHKGRHSEAAHEIHLICAPNYSKGRVGHARVEWVMQGWGGWAMLGWGCMGHAEVGWGGSCKVRWGGVGHEG